MFPYPLPTWAGIKKVGALGSLGLSLQLLIWVVNLFMGGINFLTWGVKFYMPRTQGKRIKNQEELKK